MSGVAAMESGLSKSDVEEYDLVILGSGEGSKYVA